MADAMNAFPLSPEMWPSDDDTKTPTCASCELTILPSIFRTNKHHCRKCGSLVCDTCSAGKLDGFRVCDDCRIAFKNANKGDRTQLLRLASKRIFRRQQNGSTDTDTKDDNESPEEEPSVSREADLQDVEEDENAVDNRQSSTLIISPPPLAPTTPTPSPSPPPPEDITTALPAYSDGGGRGGLTLFSPLDNTTSSDHLQVPSGASRDPSPPPPPTPLMDPPPNHEPFTQEAGRTDRTSVTTFIFPENSDPNVDNYGMFDISTPFLSRSGHELDDEDERPEQYLDVPRGKRRGGYSSSDAESNSSAEAVISIPANFGTPQSPDIIPPRKRQRKQSDRMLALQRAQENRGAIQELLDQLKSDADAATSEDEKRSEDMNASLTPGVSDLHVNVSAPGTARSSLDIVSSVDSLTTTPRHSQYLFFCEDDIEADDKAEFEEYIDLMRQGESLSLLVEKMQARGVSEEKIKQFQNSQVKRLRRIRKSRPSSPVVSPPFSATEDRDLPRKMPGFEKRKSLEMEEDNLNDTEEKIFDPERSEANLKRLNHEVVTHEDMLAAQYLPPLPDYQPNVDMQQVFWRPVPLERVANSVWAHIRRNPDHIDEAEIEEYFQFQVSTRRRRLSAPSLQSAINSRSSEEVIALTTNERALQVQSGLTKMSMQDRDIKRAVYSLDPEVLNSENLKTLRAILPANHELDAVREFNGERNQLGRAEQFFYLFKHTIDLDTRLQLFTFRLRFKSTMSKFKQKMTQVQNCLSYMNKDENLECFLSRMVSVSNYLNSRANRATYGFSLSSIEAMTITKSQTKGISVLTYVCQTFMKNNDGNVVENIVAMKDEIMEAAAVVEKSLWQEWNKMKIDLEYQKKRNKWYRENLKRLQLSMEPKSANDFRKELEQQTPSKGLKHVRSDMDLKSTRNESTREPDVWSKVMDRFFSRAAKSLQSSRERLSKLKKHRQKIAMHYGESHECTWDDLFAMALKFVTQVEASRDFVLAQDSEE